MILVFGGTTEGKKTVEVLEALQLSYVYSTKTEINFDKTVYGSYRFGALSEKELKVFIELNNISLIINAAHPFATVLHQTIALVSEKTRTPVIRLERQYPERKKHPLVHYVSDYDDALVVLQKEKKTLLALSGVQSISKLESYWKEIPSYFRILDRASSIEMALVNGFPKKQLILGLPNKAAEEEIFLIQQHKIGIILTKESGDSGSLSAKIEAALEVGIPIIIIEKPELSNTFQLAHNQNELEELITHHSKFITKEI